MGTNASWNGADGRVAPGDSTVRGEAAAAEVEHAFEEGGRGDDVHSVSDDDSSIMMYSPPYLRWLN
jgi:hypothetical protein